MDSSTSSIVGALGGGSGVDMMKLASDLSKARFAAQVSQIEARRQLTETRISAASTLRNQLSQLAAALGDRIRSGDLAPSASLSQPGIATVSVAPGATPRGTFSLEVGQLASSQTLAGKTFAGADALVGEGTLTLRFGTVEGVSFTPDAARDPIAIELTPGDTLATLAGKINTSGNGLTAYVASGAGGAQLVIKGPEGAANGFTITGSGPSAMGGAASPGAIDYLDWSPADDAGQLKQVARNAQFRLDGIDMSSPSNQITGLPGGMTLSLAGTTLGMPAQIAFAARDTAISGLMKDLVSALNEIAGQLNSSADPMGGELGNDPGARALRRSLSMLAGSVVMPNAGGGEPRSLGDLGLALDRDGTFRLDNAVLDRSLKEQPAASAAMFTVGINGVFATLDKVARATGLSSDPGSLGGSIVRYGKAQADLADRLTLISEKQEALRLQLARSLTWADRNIASSQSTLIFLKNQIAVWNAPRS